MSTLQFMARWLDGNGRWSGRWIGRAVLWLAGLIVIAPAVSVPVPVHAGPMHASMTGRGAATGHLDDRFDDAVRSLRKVTQVRADGAHIRLLSSLRQLRDPALEPMFSALTQVSEPSIQVNAILGLAELSEDHHIDVWKLSRIASLRYQAIALLEAFEADLVGPDQLREILRWPNINEELAVRVWLMLLYLDHDQDTTGLKALFENGELPVTRAYAALALLQAGQSEGCAEALKALNDLPAALHDQALNEMFGTVDRLEFTACADWVRTTIDRDDLSPTTQSTGLAALLNIAPATGAQVWKKRYESAGGIAARMHLAGMLLETADKQSADVFSAMAEEEYDLLRDIGRAGSAAARDEEAMEECLALVGHHNPPTSLWVLEHADKVEPESAVRLHAALVRDTFEGRGALNERLELARQSAKKLVDLDIDTLSGLLAEARQGHHRLTIEAILLGAIASHNRAALKLVSGDPTWDSNRATSLAVILKAHHSETLDDKSLEQLSLVFRGGGAVALPGEVQAAWLYLRLTGQDGSALAAVLGDLMLEDGH